MSEGNGLPKGWVKATIGDVIKAKVSQDGAEKGSSFVYVDISSVNNEIKRIDEPRTLPFTEAPSRARQRLEKGDVLVSMTRPNLNAVAVVPDSLHGAIGSTGFDVLRSKEVASGWLLYAVQTNGFIHAMCELVQGALYPAVRPRDIRAYMLPLPPLPEQHRIVEKIEELFSDLDAGVASLERAKRNLKRYRASVLKSAVEGRLTEEWRKEHPQTEDGGMLLDRILRVRREKWEKDQLLRFKEKGKEPPKNWQSKYEEPSAPDGSELPELPEGWVWASLEAVANVTGGITKDKKKDSLPGLREVPYLRVANVQRGFLDLSEMKTIKASPEDIQELALCRGDVLFTEGGDRDKLGRGWIWSEELPECIHQNHIFRARLSSSGIQPSLVSHHGNTFGRQWFTKAGKQTTNLASINLGILKRFPVPLPPPAEQEQIVEVDPGFRAP